MQAPGPRGPLIQLCRVVKIYPMGQRTYTALRGVDLTFEAGEFTAIVGQSGSGKSTILNMITGIDRPTSGAVIVAGRPIQKLSENALARWRGANVGIVFQFFQLLPTLTALENVMLPMDFLQAHAGRRRERAAALLRRVALEEHAGHLPSELSGGEQQRVAIARALANDPPILIADEPTGNLDSATGVRIFELLGELSRQGKLVIFVTHDPLLAQNAARVITVHDGRVLTDVRPPPARATTPNQG
ncbi:MAG: ABC transporter ATP-binding protein [Candidatus Dormibacteraeota bacterium]|nr:ABC transporter ATP-binding protein [Candidatus Dormibacteraeota bacterium]